jgi:hypothetical protein
MMLSRLSPKIGYPLVAVLFVVVEALEKSYGADPDDPWAANEMTIVARGLEAGRGAMQCHQWTVADEQFKIPGDQADASHFGNGTQAALSAARATAARLADRPVEQGE